MSGAGVLLILVGAFALITYLIQKVVYITRLLILLVYGTLKFSALPNRKDRSDAVKDWLHGKTKDWL